MKANYVQLLKEAIEELFDYNSSYYEKIFILINQVDENTDFVELSIQILFMNVQKKLMYLLPIKLKQFMK